MSNYKHPTRPTLDAEGAFATGFAGLILRFLQQRNLPQVVDMMFENAVGLAVVRALSGRRQMVQLRRIKVD